MFQHFHMSQSLFSNLRSPIETGRLNKLLVLLYVDRRADLLKLRIWKWLFYPQQTLSLYILTNKLSKFRLYNLEKYQA